MANKKGQEPQHKTAEELLREQVNAIRIEKNHLKKISLIFKESGFSEFLQYLRNPWRIMWVNFMSGVFKGLGIIVGMTVVFAFLIWVLGFFVDFPLVGEYISTAIQQLESYAPPAQ